LLRTFKRDIAHFGCAANRCRTPVLAYPPAADLRQHPAAPTPRAPSDAGGTSGTFEPLSPTIVVILRTAGRAAALAALATIHNPEQLRLLAGEQCLAGAPELASLERFCPPARFPCEP
jgi:hypothetical protein